MKCRREFKFLCGIPVLSSVFSSVVGTASPISVISSVGIAPRLSITPLPGFPRGFRQGLLPDNYFLIVTEDAGPDIPFAPRAVGISSISAK